MLLGNSLRGNESVNSQNQWNSPDPMAVMRISSAYWAEEIGFTDLSFRPLPDPSPFTLIQGIKPK